MLIQISWFPSFSQPPFDFLLVSHLSAAVFCLGEHNLSLSLSHFLLAPVEMVVTPTRSNVDFVGSNYSGESTIVMHLGCLIKSPRA